jgi:hypothetical protein
MPSDFQYDNPLSGIEPKDPSPTIKLDKNDKQLWRLGPEHISYLISTFEDLRDRLWPKTVWSSDSEEAANNSRFKAPFYKIAIQLHIHHARASILFMELYASLGANEVARLESLNPGGPPTSRADVEGKKRATDEAVTFKSIIVTYLRHGRDAEGAREDRYVLQLLRQKLQSLVELDKHIDLAMGSVDLNRLRSQANHVKVAWNELHDDPLSVGEKPVVEVIIATWSNILDMWVGYGNTYAPVHYPIALMKVSAEAGACRAALEGTLEKLSVLSNGIEDANERKLMAVFDSRRKKDHALGYIERREAEKKRQEAKFRSLEYRWTGREPKAAPRK